MTRSILVMLGLVLLPALVIAQIKPIGIIQGKIIENPDRTPVEYANVALIDTFTGKLINGAVTDSAGSFRLSDIPNGVYFLEYSPG